MNQLTTRWGRSLDPEHVHEEYPRPQLRRASYLNLNGAWTYMMAGETGTILVPFSPEAALSGVEKVLRPGQCLQYRRIFTLPEGFVQDRVLLHFGAVDQECTVYLNGQEAGRHSGGYLAFEIDITHWIHSGENELRVDVWDATEQSPHARGKQRLDKLKGRMSYLFYTPQSGIWKTVWLESVPNVHVRGLRITPDLDAEDIHFRIDGAADGTMTLEILDGEQVLWRHTGEAAAEVTAHLPGLERWSPEHPKLYDVRLTWGKDEVRSYFGMRKVSVQPDARGVLRFFLNNRPYFFNGVLDQGYWPDGLMTPPSDEALVHDIQTLKAMGYNTIRKHIKVESDRFYYHCDRLGMCVWQDMPNGGGSYIMAFVTYLPNILPWTSRVVPDKWYGLYARRDAQGRAQYAADLTGMLAQLYNHPSIVAWTAFNEGWGQFDARKATTLIRANDGTRLVNEACGWYDQGGGDMYSIHNYFHRLSVKPQRDRVVALTEYGGYAYEVGGHVACEKKVGYKSYPSTGELLEDYRRLWEEQLTGCMAAGLSAAIYTQTSDIEEEINGLMTYDREITKLAPEVLSQIHTHAKMIFEKVTCE